MSIMGSSIIIVIYLVGFGIGVYVLLLLMRLINRATKALEIYIDNNDRSLNQDRNY
jgi:uncharacterized membrane-anchored protein YhcB (DUF1043 family)